MSIIRTRWAAIGAAVAITLGAGGIGLVSATSPSGAVTFVPITPCRLFDTRPEFQVGTRSAPIGPGDIHTVEATGNNGDCTDIPTTATAVSMNMTSTNATAPTFLTVWATGETRPDASSMNPVPGAPATPNSVISALNTNGKFSVFNLAGNVHVFADINGYYTDHHHDARYYTKGQADSRYAPLQSVITVDPLDFVDLGAGWSQDGDLVGRDGGGGSSCIQAPLELPVGASIDSVRLTYLTFGASVDVKILSFRRVAGRYNSAELVSGPETVPFVGEFVLGEASIPVDDSGPILIEHGHLLEVCTGAPFYVSAVEIALS